MLEKKELVALYIGKRLSASEIAKRLRCSEHKVNYWLSKNRIIKRSISDAVYQKWNPSGDPFSTVKPKSITEAIHYGIGLGLYWGEGTKANKTSVRLGNSNPALIRRFVDFLVFFYEIDRQRLRFGLQIFGDMNEKDALRYWMNVLQVSRKQFYPKIIVTPYRGIGNYRQKTKYSLLTLFFNNRKLRDIICRALDEESMRRLPT